MDARRRRATNRPRRTSGPLAVAGDEPPPAGKRQGGSLGAFSEKRARYFLRALVGTPGTRIMYLSRALAGYPSKKKASLVPHPLEAEIVEAEEPPTTAYEAPKFDKSKLIVEEIGMGMVNIPKAEMGSEVIASFKFKSEEGQEYKSIKNELVLGTGNVLRGLHEGLVGMRPFDIRKITIPPSVCLCHGSASQSATSEVRRERGLVRGEQW